MKTITLTNEQFNYLDNLIIKINRKLGLIKQDDSMEDGMSGGLRGLLFSIQANLSYPEDEDYIRYDDGEIEIVKTTIELSNEQIFFLIKILEDEAFKNKKSTKKVVRKLIKEFEINQPKFID